MDLVRNVLITSQMMLHLSKHKNTQSMLIFYHHITEFCLLLLFKAVQPLSLMTRFFLRLHFAESPRGN